MSKAHRKLVAQMAWGVLAELQKHEPDMELPVFHESLKMAERTAGTIERWSMTPVPAPTPLVA